MNNKKLIIANTLKFKVL